MVFFNQLPNELVSKIMSFVKCPKIRFDEDNGPHIGYDRDTVSEDDGSFYEASDGEEYHIVHPVKVSERDGMRQLRSCCLVCRRWLPIAQPLLFEQVALHGSLAPIRFRENLRRSNTLARYVRELTVTSRYELVDPLEATTLLEDCIELTTALEKLVLDRGFPSLVTSDLLRRICRLPNLKSFTLSIYHNHSPISEFQPELFLQLPPTIEELKFRGVSTDLLNLLPEICAKLRPSQFRTQETFSSSNDNLVRCDRLAQDTSAHCSRRLSRTHAEGFQLLAGNVEEMTTDIIHLTITTDQAELPVSFSGMEEQRAPVTPVAGLRALSLGINQSYPPNLLTAIGHSVTMLTSLSLTLYPYISKYNESDVVNCLSATPLLQHLRLDIRPCQVLLDILPRMSQLKSLNVSIVEPTMWLDEDGVAPRQPNEDGFFLSLARFISHCKHLDTFTFTGHYRLDLPRLIDVVIKSTTNNMAGSTLRTLEITGSEEFPIDVLEHLCQSAPLLQKLKIWLPSDLARFARAIEKFKHLDFVKLWVTKSGDAWFPVRHLGGEYIDVGSLVRKIDM